MNPGRRAAPAAMRSAPTSRSTDTISTPSSIRSTDRARTTHSTGSAPRRHHRRRRRKATPPSPHRGEMTTLKRPRLDLYRKRDPRRRDRHAVDVASSAIRQRMTELPSLLAEGRERSSNLILRVRADATAPGQPPPAAGVDQQGDRDDGQHGGDGRGAQPRGGDGERARPQACRADRGRSAHAPVLELARKASLRHDGRSQASRRCARADAAGGSRTGPVHDLATSGRGLAAAEADPEPARKRRRATTSAARAFIDRGCSTAP